MSMLNRPSDGRDTGEVVAAMRDYESAQKTVSKLIAAEVPARDIAIIGQGVRTVERVTGKLGYAAAARSGAINGILIGLFLSAILVLGNPVVPMQLFVGFVFIGVAVGMLLSLVTYAIVRRRRDFASVTQFAADHYEVTVMPTSLAKARQALGAQRTAPVRPPVNLDEPPKYGERIPPGGATAAPSTPDAQRIPPRPPAPQFGERMDGPAATEKPFAAPASGPVAAAPAAAAADPAAPVPPAVETPAPDADAPGAGDTDPTGRPADDRA